MIEILPVTDEQKLAQFCADNALSSESAVMTAVDGDEILGSVAGHIEDKVFIITYLETPFAWLKDGLVKSILAYADNRFILNAKTFLNEDKAVFRNVGFKENGDFMEIEISKVIHNCG